MIQLKHIRPNPIFGDGQSIESQVWDQALHFQQGKQYLIEAASGKGKSTLLHIIYGLRQDFEGEASIDAKPSNQIDLNAWSDLRSKRLSIVFQDLRLFPKLTALENIQLNNRDQHHSISEIQAMAKQLGVEMLLDKTAQTLSYGQRQRIAIIRALCQTFDFILLDEPFSHLDEANTALAMQLIQAEIQAQKASMILVSLGGNFGIDFDERLKL